MNIPQSVNQAVIIIWATLFVSTVVAVINKLIGSIDSSYFITGLITYGLLCIFPYKISRGSNPTRYVYVVITVITCFMLFAGITMNMPKLDVILSYFLVPVDLFIIYKLFSKDANDWFSQNRQS